jgi:peptide/nickel transport system permease protein
VRVYAVKRVVWTGALFLALATVTFVLFFVLPHANAAPGRRRAGLTPRPPLDVHGSLVHEYGPGLVLGGAVIWMLIALPLGLLSALRPRSLTAKAGGAFALIGLSVHPLWLGLALSWVFGDRLGWFPSGGYCDTLGPQPDCGGPIPWANHMALPWAAFALLYGAYYVRLIRVNASGALEQDYVRTARAKGVSDWGVLRSHVLATTVRPILTALVLDVGGLAMGTFGAAIFVETAFGIPGLGRTAAQSFQRRDFPVIIGILLFVTATVVVANLIADLAAAALDPRVRRRAAPV